MGVRVCASLAQPEDTSRPREFHLGWYLQRCTDLALLLLGGDPKLVAPCSVGEGSVTRRELVRLALVEGKDVVLPKPEGFTFEAGSGSIPYTTEILQSGCLKRQDARVVDTVVRMFMGVAVCSSKNISVEHRESLFLALWEVRSFCIE